MVTSNMIEPIIQQFNSMVVRIGIFTKHKYVIDLLNYLPIRYWVVETKKMKKMRSLKINKNNNNSSHEMPFAYGDQ